MHWGTNPLQGPGRGGDKRCSVLAGGKAGSCPSSHWFSPPLGWSRKEVDRTILVLDLVLVGLMLPTQSNGLNFWMPSRTT